MSVAEIKNELPKLTVEERKEIAALIAFLNRKDDVEYHAELQRRMERMDRGAKMTSEQVYKAHPETNSGGQ